MSLQSLRMSTVYLELVILTSLKGTLGTLFPMTCDHSHFKFSYFFKSFVGSKVFPSSSQQLCNLSGPGSFSDLAAIRDTMSSRDRQGEDICTGIYIYYIVTYKYIYIPRKFDIWNPGISSICEKNVFILRDQCEASKRAIGSEQFSPFIHCKIRRSQALWAKTAWQKAKNELKEAQKPRRGCAGM